MGRNIKRLIVLLIIVTISIAVRYTIINNKLKQMYSNNEETKIQHVEKESNIPSEDTYVQKQQTDLHIASSEKQPSRGGHIDNQVDITLTFYTGLPEENGGYTDINCTGNKLTPGTVANNVLPLGTKIYTNEFGTLTVADRGGSNFDTIHRLDVYISRKSGESNSNYMKRVNDMGRVKIKGYIVKP